MKDKNYALFKRADYFRDLISNIQSTKSGDRVAMTTMTIDPRIQLTQELVSALSSAARRGVSVIFTIDAQNFRLRRPTIEGPILPGPLFLRKKLPNKLSKRHQECFDLITELNKVGAKAKITNLPDSRIIIPHSGICHIKAAVINDIVYVGGCNFTNTSEYDASIRFNDKLSANKVFDWLGRIEKSGSVYKAFGGQDDSYKIDDDTTLYIDAGTPKQSLIYEKSLKLIDRAEEWVYLTSQYVPGGRTARHLAAAEDRGVKVEIVYSNPAVHRLQEPYHRLLGLNERLLRRTPSDLFVGQLKRNSPNMHAKVLATDQGAMIGSHNYISQSVTMGTAEMTLYRRNDIEFSKTLREFIKSQLEET